MPYFITGYDLASCLRLRRDTPEGALKKARELEDALYFNVEIESPEGTVLTTDQFAATLAALVQWKAA